MAQRQGPRSGTRRPVTETRGETRRRAADDGKGPFLQEAGAVFVPSTLATMCFPRPASGAGIDVSCRWGMVLVHGCLSDFSVSLVSVNDTAISAAHCCGGPRVRVCDRPWQGATADFSPFFFLVPFDRSNPQRPSGASSADCPRGACCGALLQLELSTAAACRQVADMYRIQG